MGWRRNKLTLYASIPECPQVDILFNTISKEKIDLVSLLLKEIYSATAYLFVGEFNPFKFKVNY